MYTVKKDDFSKVPDTLANSMGKMEFVMSLELTPELKLAREEMPERLLKALRNKVFLYNCPLKKKYYKSRPDANRTNAFKLVVK